MLTTMMVISIRGNREMILLSSQQAKTVFRIRTILVFLIIGIAMVFIYGETKKSALLNSLSGSLYLAEGDYLVRHNLSTGEKMTLLSLYDKRGARSIIRSNYSISQNGCRIAYIESAKQPNHSLAGDTEVVVYDQCAKHVIYKHRHGVTGTPYISLSISPSGRYISTVTLYPEAQSCVLSIIDTKTGLDVTKKDAGFGIPSWHPNSMLLAYEDQWARPLVLNVISHESTRIQGHGRPLWSPDGERLVVGESIILINGNKLTKNILLPQEARVVAWSPDSRHLLYEMPSEVSGYPLYVYTISSKESYRIPFRSSQLEKEPTFWNP